MLTFHRWLLVVLCLGCAATHSSPPASSSGSPDTAPQSDTDSSVDPAMHMRRLHYVALELRDAVIAGDIARARSTAEQLRTNLRLESFPPSLRPYADKLDVQARQASEAPDLQRAATAVAHAAKRCGDCHWHTRSGPRDFRVDVRLPTQGEESLRMRMVRHGVASDQLWLGLVVPSDEMWQKGGKTLASAPLSPPTFDEDPPPPLTPSIESTEAQHIIAEQVEHLRDVSLAVRRARTHTDRADVYATYLAGCATCHARAGR